MLGFVLAFFLLFSGAAYAAPNVDIIRQQLVYSVPHYYVWGLRFVHLQVYFRLLFVLIIAVMILAFFLHYIIIGPKEFEEGGRKIKFFNVFNRFIHWLAALSFILIIPSGLVMVYARYFGGDGFVRLMRFLHDIGAALFFISVIPMFVMWVKDMLPVPRECISWLSTMGGYLTKKKVQTGAGKFNPGQKFWFWIATLVGSVMLATGFVMYYREFPEPLPLMKYQIDSLRFVAIVHNFAAMLILAMFLVHLYMSLFVVKGSLKSMITGYKSEDEVKHLHSAYYEKLMKKKNGKG